MLAQKFRFILGSLAVLASITAALLLNVSRNSQHVASHRPVPTEKVTPKSALPAPPAPPMSVDPVQYLPLTPDQAIALNMKQPSSGDAGPSAAPFRIQPSSAGSARAIKCLSDAVYYEAASEDEDGQRAVAQVVLNRVRNPAFPATICGVVYQGSDRATGCQFTFTCDGSLARSVSTRAWLRAQTIARKALDGSVFKPIGYSTHYHANYVVPYWASSLTRTATIGAHIFYRWQGAPGRAAAFRQQYAGTEPAPWSSVHQFGQAGSVEVADALNITGSLPALPQSQLRSDDANSRPTLAAERDLRGSILLIDEHPSHLVASLASKSNLTSTARSSSSKYKRDR